MPTLQEGLGLISKIRETNPGLDSLNDQEIADLVYNQTNDPRILPVKQSSAIGRGVAKTGQFFSDLGQKAENVIADENSPFLQQIAGRTAGQLVSSLPEMGLTMLSGGTSGLASKAAMAGLGAFSYGRTKAETGDEGAALGSAAGSVLSALGGVKGAEIGRKLGGGKGVKGFLAGTAGSAVGSVPGDVLEIGTSPGGLEEFVKDPLNVPAYLAGNVVVGAGLDLVGEAAASRMQKVQKVKAETPELDTILRRSAADELVALQKKPVAELTELDIARRRELHKTLAELEERTLAAKMNKVVAPTDINLLPEAPVTIRAQKYLLHKGKKSVIEIPKGTELPVSNPHSYEQLAAQYTSPLNGNLYEYDDAKVTPEIIDNAIKSNTLGTLLGYGTPGLPAKPSGEIAVLRNNQGHEKAAVILGDGNEQAVMKALQDMALGTDVVRIEKPAQVAQWRAKHAGLKELKSLSTEVVDPQADIGFTNKILDLFEQGVKGSERKGPRFQLDQNGMINGTGLLKAVKQWAPAEMWDHYKQAGIETLLGSNKVPAAEFTKWIRENTPEVEVKKLEPFDQFGGQRAQHELENLGYRVGEDSVTGVPILTRGEGEVNLALQPERVRNLWAQYESMGEVLANSDAATGRYGVEPKPLEQMPGAVDILVRVPLKDTPPSKITEGYLDIRSDEEQARYAKQKQKSGLLFRGPHFGDSDTNVLASIRGYMETLPSGEKVFHIFEVQSDWGQQRAKGEIYNQREGNAPGTGEGFDYFYKDTPNHPLLSSYETLALKTAIQHARAEGATKIAISDAETAMMTEGHDRQNNPVDRFSVAETPDGHALVWDRGATADQAKTFESVPFAMAWISEQKVRPTQEPGMRAAYDDRLPTIAKKLTGDKGQMVDFGLHKAQAEQGLGGAQRPLEGSPVFNGKTNITARLYDITHPSPELTRLFSLYDLDKQNTFDATVAKEMAARESRNPEEFTPRQMLERAIQGDKKVNLDALTNFIEAIKGTRGALREGTIFNPGTFAVMDVKSRDIKFNRNVSLTVQEAHSKLAHELTHGAILDLKGTDPVAYQAAIDTVDQLGLPARQTILTELKKAYKLGDKFDVDYLAGARFDKADPYLREKTMHEFTGGIMEATAKAFADKNTGGDYLRFLPQPVQKIISAVVRRLKEYFRPEMPSMSAMLDESQANSLNKIVDLMQKEVISIEQANLRATLGLSKTSPFDESGMIANAPTWRQDLQKGGMGGELGSFASEFRDATLGKLATKFEDLIMSALFRTRTHPFTKDHFWNLHGFRPNLQAENFGYLAFLGQDEKSTLSQQQALDRWGSYFDKVLSNPTSKEGLQVRKAISEIVEENTSRRERFERDGTPITWDKMVQRGDMVSQYGLTPEQANYVDRIIKLPELVIKEQHRKNELTDAHAVAKMFYRANKAQDINGVVEKVLRLSRIANDFGAKRYELDVYTKQHKAQKAAGFPDQDFQLYLEENINRLRGEQDAFKILFDQAIRAEFAGSIPIKQGPDSFVSATAEMMTRMASARWVAKFMTQDAGYAPMTRRGRFFLRVFEPNILGDEFGRKEVMAKGFNTKEELDAFVKKEGLLEQNIQVLDKNELRDRAQFYSPDRMKQVADRNKEQLGSLVEEIMNNPDLAPDQRALLQDTLTGLMHDFGRTVQEELADVLAVKGDKFKERRWLVPGFDKEDFLPNIFEYMDYKSVAGNKQLTRARGELQLERPELDKDPEMRHRMEQELNYTLSNQSEANAFRKAVFYFYLGASHRHIIQNAVQMPLNGVSQMVANGTGVGQSYKFFSKAAALAAKYNLRGTTGDREIDILLKQAEKDGVSFQAALESPLHEGIELQNSLDSLNAQREGSIQAGARIKHASTRLWKGFEKFLMSTSSAAEAANRKTTFIASILDSRAKGQKDPLALYKEASEFTNYVNFVGDKPNRPGYMIKEGGRPMHGPLAIWSALQSFTINHLSQLYAFHKLGKAGSEADRKAFYTGLAHLAALSGAMGLVGASTAEALFEEVTGVSLKTALRRGLVEHLPFGDGAADRISDTILGGLPALAGMDASNSIGLGSPFFRYQAGQPLGIEQFGGAGIGMLGRVGQAFGQVTEDPFNPQQWWKATRSAAPAFLSNFLRVAEVTGAGTVLDTNQQPVSDPLGVAGSASALLGFTPQEVSKQRQVNSLIYKSTKKMGEEYDHSVKNIAQELNRFQATGEPDALLHANQMMQKYLESVGGMQDRGAMIQSITDQLGEFQGRVTKPATLKESASRRRIESAFPSIKPRYAGQLESALSEIEVLMLMGQADLLEQKLDSLSSSLPDAVLTDLLVQAGLPPEDARLALSPGRAARLGDSPVR